MPESTIVVICENPACGKEFTKRFAEFKRSEKLGRQHFCCKSCYGKFKGLINIGDKVNRDTSYLRDIISISTSQFVTIHWKFIKSK